LQRGVRVNWGWLYTYRVEKSSFVLDGYTYKF
jgi:hypothetical protein